MLANSWVGQKFGSIGLYFLIYVIMNSGCLAERAEVRKIRKKGRLSEPTRTDRSDPPSDRSEG